MSGYSNFVPGFGRVICHAPTKPAAVNRLLAYGPMCDPDNLEISGDDRAAVASNERAILATLAEEEVAVMTSLGEWQVL